jgi:phage-related protein
MITKLWEMIPPLAAQAAHWLSIYGPILIVIGIIALAISAARQFGASWEEIFGFVGGVIGIFATFFYNRFVKMWNTVAAFINFFGNAFSNPIASIGALFFDLAVNVLGFIETMAKGIEDLLNKIPGVEVNITGGITGLKDKLAAASADIKSEADLKTYVKTKEFMDYSDGYSGGNKIGKNIQSNLDGAIDKFTNSMTDKGIDLSQFGTQSNPLMVEEKGKNNAVEVDMTDEDLGYLRDIAEREYINKFSTATLAPQIQVQFGDVHQEADADKVAGRIKMILQEEIATAAEGVY